VEKTKLGVSACFVSAVAYLFGLFSNYVAVGLIVGYILLKEEDLQLRKNALRVLALMLLFSLIGLVIYLIPDIMGLITQALEIVGIHLYFSKLNSLSGLLDSVVDLVEKAVFIGLAVLSLANKNFKLPVVDAIINKFLHE